MIQCTDTSCRQLASSVRPRTSRLDSSNQHTFDRPSGLQLRSSNPMASGAIVTKPRSASSRAYAWSGCPARPTTSLLPRWNCPACWWWQNTAGSGPSAPLGTQTYADTRWSAVTA